MKTESYRLKSPLKIYKQYPGFIDVSIYDDVSHVAANLANVSSSDISFSFKMAKKTSDTVVLTKSSATSTEINKDNAASGVVQVRFQPSDFTNITPDMYWFQIILTDTSTNPDLVMPVVTGEIIIAEGI